MPSITVNKALQLDGEVGPGRKTFHFSNPWEIRYVDGKHSDWHSKDRELPKNLLLAFGVCDEDDFPNIYRPLLNACTLPITSAEAERSFSLMK